MKNTFKIPWTIILILSIILIHSCKKDNATTPVLSTVAVSAITQTTAISGGNITSDGGDSITVRGVCWGTSPNPVINGNHTTDGSSTGSFISNLTGLTATTTYYIRAYASNAAGTSYGNEFTFTTPATSLSVTDIDLNVYNTVNIGSQIWMVENLKTTRYNDNTAIPLINDIIAWGALTTPGYCWYHNDESSYKAYGALYNWYTVDSQSNGGKNICPTGWHVPSDAEWDTLIIFLGGEAVAGGKLKETGTTHWSNPNTGANNETGFSALPGGSRNLAGSFVGIGSYGIWWSATEVDATLAWRNYMDCNLGSSERGNGYKQGGFSVRCLQD
ncbi:MAG: fibrobacter succinogenes major paralogous domain-containing protein [Bacteroidales bacterium]